NPPTNIQVVNVFSKAFKVFSLCDSGQLNHSEIFTNDHAAKMNALTGRTHERISNINKMFELNVFR
ncbi:hypothetical protein, partial [Yersinia pestis]|uniref:hypothetical protein n=1 Tax=Yersinia pestis TaxID=632 RepID=UPI000ABB3C66